MKAKLILLAGLALLTASCDNVIYPSDDNSRVTAPVTIHVNDFSISQQEFPDEDTRSVSDVKDYKPVQAVTLALYDGNTQVYSSTQIKDKSNNYTTFGQFDCSLPVGTYTLVAIGRGCFDGDEFTLTSPTAAGYTSDRARETFCCVQTVSVTSTAPLDLSVTMSRVIAQLEIKSTDGRSAGVKKFRTTYPQGSKSFNPTTGLATDDAGIKVTNSPSAKAGETVDFGSFVFLAGDEAKMDITIEALDDCDQVLFTKVITDVPFKRNRKTVLTGAMFTSSSNSAASLKLDTDWLDPVEIGF